MPPFAVTVLEMTELGRIAFHGEFGEPDETDEAAALEALDTIGIRHLAGRLCSEISGGEYQLALFARALAAGPRLLLLDEPEAGLDFRNQRRILSTLKSLRGKGVSSVFITHYPDRSGMCRFRKASGKRLSRRNKERPRERRSAALWMRKLVPIRYSAGGSGD